jgi:hypothetical protein
LSQKQGGKVHPFLSALLLPILVPVALVAVPLSIPISRMRQRRMQKQEEAFRAQMRASSRVIEWAEFAQAIEDDLGTPIEERYDIKGPVRWWWTTEDVREQSPHPFSDWSSMRHDVKFAPFIDWFHTRYVHPETGRALLVWPPQTKEQTSLSTQAKELKEKSHRWMDAVMPETFAVKNGHASKTDSHR